MDVEGSRRVVVIGLDSAPPELVFDRWRDDLPAIGGLMASGVYAKLRSTIPPITVPAWSAMMTGLDPGTLGFYGFRNRADYSYGRMRIATSEALRHPRVWEILSRERRPVVVLNVPQTYPPRPVNGVLVADFLTPGTQCEYTWPPELKRELDDVTGGYEIDAGQFRTDDKARLLDDIHRITGKHFAAARHLMASRPWHFFITVEMGTDRIQHGFWSHFDAGHRKHDPASPFKDAIRKYYVRVDKEIGELLAVAGPEVVTLVVSDHGAQRTGLAPARGRRGATTRVSSSTFRTASLRAPCHSASTTRSGHASPAKSPPSATTPASRSAPSCSAPKTSMPAAGTFRRT